MTLTPYPAQDAEAIRRGYKQYAPPSAPTGMYVDRKSGLVLPQGVRPRSIGRVAAAWCLAVLLFVLTLGIGYLVWSVIVWDGGQTPAQKLLGLRCWDLETGRPGSRGQMAIRQITGLLLNGELLMGPFILLASKDRASVGDFFVDTVVLYDPNHVLLTDHR